MTRMTSICFPNKHYQNSAKRSAAKSSRDADSAEANAQRRRRRRELIVEKFRNDRAIKQFAGAEWSERTNERVTAVFLGNRRAFLERDISGSASRTVYARITLRRVAFCRVLARCVCQPNQIRQSSSPFSELNVVLSDTIRRLMRKERRCNPVLVLWNDWWLSIEIRHVILTDTVFICRVYCSPLTNNIQPDYGTSFIMRWYALACLPSLRAITGKKARKNCIRIPYRRIPRWKAPTCSCAVERGVGRKDNNN